MRLHPGQRDRVVITGIGMTTSTGSDRESVWRAVCAGRSGVRQLNDIPGIPAGMLLGAPVKIQGEFPGQLKDIPLSRATAAEALSDSQLELARIDRSRIACCIGGHMGDTDYVVARVGRSDLVPPGKGPWWRQWLPNSTCSVIANDFGLRGPRLVNSTACATGTIAFLMAVRAILDNRCDVALTGSAQSIHPLFAAGFNNMRVLAHHENPTKACRPFDAHRNGFVMGEGSAMLVLERLSYALERHAPIYAEVLGGHLLADAHHVTDLAGGCDALVHLIDSTLRKSRLAPSDVHHINAHGTGTKQNDRLEAQGIRQALGLAAYSICVSANKSMLGHLVNASGSVEIALATLALRDGFAPPTINLTSPDPDCDLDCIPLIGRQRTMEHALKLSIAFGGHMAAVALRRWSDVADRRAEIPLRRAA